MQIYLVGGAVRDALLGYPVKEKDYVVVGARPKQMIALGYTAVGKDFPVFLHPHSKEEYALARTERKSGHGYQGFTFNAAPDISLEQDLSRRDLTINAMAQDDTGTLIDPFDGARDLQQRILRHVSPAFAEDPVRILRVARFAARYHHLGFRVASETLALMRDIVHSGEVAHLVAERVWKEFSRALDERDPAQFLKVLFDCEAMAVLWPELAREFSQGQNFEAHPLIHSLQFSCHAGGENAERFGSMVRGFINKDAAQSFIQRLKLPNSHAELATLVCREAAQVDASLQLDASALLALLQRTDSLRKPHRFLLLLNCCANHALANSSAAEYKQKDYLLACLHIIKGVTARVFVDRGLSGRALGEAIQTQQETLLESHIQAHNP